MHCTVAYCKSFYSITVAGAASDLLSVAENLPTSHFILQTTVCGIPEAKKIIICAEVDTDKPLKRAVKSNWQRSSNL
jgi:hypothetical protein